MATRDYIGFTMDVRKLASVLAQDPKCRAELIAGLQGQPEPLTSQLGAANLTAGTGEDTWCSLFPATVQGKQSGEQGLFYRNDAKGSARGAGDGDRIQMRLKKQPKQTQYAQTPAQTLPQYAQTPAQTLPQAAPAQVDAAQLIAMAAADPQAFAAILAQAAGQPTVQAQPEVGAPDLPQDILDQVGTLGSQ